MRLFSVHHAQHHGMIVAVLTLMLATLSDVSDAQIFPFPNVTETDAPTAPPVAAATEAPTAVPIVATDAPTVVPITAAPTEAPVVPITASPTVSPVADPTEAPVVPETEAPTAAPVVPETVPPTSRPTESPTAATDPPATARPTLAPTFAPSAAPNPLPTTFSPTSSPVTEAPTVPATEAPTATVPTTEAPTTTATSTPTVAVPPTGPPTSGTVSPTSSPTIPPTSRPTSALTRLEVDGLSMQLNGVGEISPASKQVFEEEYARQCTDFFNGSEEQIMRAVDDYETRIEWVSETTIASRMLRRLGFSLRHAPRFLQETSSVLVTYNQELQYRADADEIVPQRVVEAPFKTKSRRDRFAERLINSNDPAYENMPAEGAVSQIIGPSTPAPSPSPDAKSSNTNTIIIAVCASVGGLLLLGGGFLLYKRRRDRKANQGFGATSLNDDEGKPPSQLQLSTVGASANDDVSTLAEPTPKLGVQSGESLAGYGDQSVATVDYDYSKAYGGGGEASVVSSAGGTLGSQTRGGVTTASGAAGLAAAGGAAAAGASIFSDDNSFEQGYGAGEVSVKEEMIEVYAPPGKLGVVIDTPDEGAPVVHAIKDSSCIADQLKVGDKLIAVDDEDVRAMTAIKVSKMISRKSANPQRKLTVVRTTVSE